MSLRLLSTNHESPGFSRGERQLKQRQAEAQKRRLGMVDERYMKQAERLLYGELSAALDIPYEEVQPYIARRAGKDAPSET